MGTFTGLGNTISNLDIQEVTPVGQFASQDNPTNGILGLFGFVGSGGVVRDVNLANAQVSGGDGVWAGALVGDLDGVVMNASSSGQVSVGSGTNNTNTGATFGFGGVYANANAGGLVGFSDGLIVNSHSSANVLGGGASAGGLVGVIAGFGSITNSSASGAVTVGDNDTGQTPTAGGLVGLASGFSTLGLNLPSLNISGSSATGSASGGNFADVGGSPPASDVFEAAISNSFATGAVSDSGPSFAGGFAGELDAATTTTSYANGAVTQTGAGSGTANDSVGGFVGLLTDGASITQSYSSGAVQSVGAAVGDANTLAGGFAGEVTGLGSSVSNSYSLGAVTVTSTSNADIGGFAGVVQASGSVDHVYATGLVSGTGQTAGLVAVLEQFQRECSGRLAVRFLLGHWHDRPRRPRLQYHAGGDGFQPGNRQCGHGHHRPRGLSIRDLSKFRLRQHLGDRPRRDPADAAVGIFHHHHQRPSSTGS